MDICYNKYLSRAAIFWEKSYNSDYVGMTIMPNGLLPLECIILFLSFRSNDLSDFGQHRQKIMPHTSFASDIGKANVYSTSPKTVMLSKCS